MKETLKKHKKKSIGLASVLGVMVTIITFWAQVYPIICPLVQHKEVCEASGKVAQKVTLDETKLDMDKGAP